MSRVVAGRSLRVVKSDWPRYINATGKRGGSPTVIIIYIFSISIYCDGPVGDSIDSGGSVAGTLVADDWRRRFVSAAASAVSVLGAAVGTAALVGAARFGAKSLLVPSLSRFAALSNGTNSTAASNRWSRSSCLRSSGSQTLSAYRRTSLSRMMVPH